MATLRCYDEALHRQLKLIAAAMGLDLGDLVTYLLQACLSGDEELLAEAKKALELGKNYVIPELIRDMEGE